MCFFVDVVIEAFVSSGTPKLEAEGFVLAYCTETEVDSVLTLTPQERNALKMKVRERIHASKSPLPSQCMISESSCISLLMLLQTRSLKR